MIFNEGNHFDTTLENLLLQLMVNIFLGTTLYKTQQVSVDLDYIKILVSQFIIIIMLICARRKYTGIFEFAQMILWN